MLGALGRRDAAPAASARGFPGAGDEVMTSRPRGWLQSIAGIARLYRNLKACGDLRSRYSRGGANSPILFEQTFHWPSPTRPNALTAKMSSRNFRHGIWVGETCQ